MSFKLFIGVTTADILRTCKKSVIPSRHILNELHEPVDMSNNILVNMVNSETPRPVDTSDKTSVKNKQKTEAHWKTILAVFQSMGNRDFITLMIRHSGQVSAQRSQLCIQHDLWSNHILLFFSGSNYDIFPAAEAFISEL